MNAIAERAVEATDYKQDRRDFFKKITKYLIGFTAFGIASLFGLKRSGEINLGRMKETEFGLSEAHGTCGYGAGCAGGGGQCGYGAGCAGK